MHILAGNRLLAQESVTTVDSVCDWELHIFADNQIEQAALQKKLLLGIIYRQAGSGYRNFYAFVANTRLARVDAKVIKQLNRSKVRPLTAVQFNSVTEQGMYNLDVVTGGATTQVIYLIKAMHKIAALEKLGTRIFPVVKNKTELTRGGSDFSGPLTRGSAVAISRLGEARSMTNAMQVCSYQLQ